MKYWFSDYIAPRLMRPADWIADRFGDHWLMRRFAARVLAATGEECHVAFSTPDGRRWRATATPR